MARRERRLRLRRREEVPEGQARMNPSTMGELDIGRIAEVVVGGKKRLRFIALPLDSVPPNEVWCNSEELRQRGVADNTIATVRAPQGGLGEH